MRPAESNADIEPCLAVVMPVYNEAGTIAEVVSLVLAQQPVQQLVIVDDASTDGTWEKLQILAEGKPTIQLARHTQNQGKGAALRTGFGLATAPLVIVQDADLEYDPGEYYRVLAPILAGRADVVFGSRFLGRQPGASGPLLLALGGQPVSDHPLEHGHQFEPDRHGDVL